MQFRSLVVIHPSAMELYVLQKLAELFLGMSACSVPAVGPMFTCFPLMDLSATVSSLCPIKLHKICFLDDKLSFIVDTM